MSLTQINKAGLDEIALDHVFTIGASGSSAYTFQGEGLNGTVNNPTLYLTRGKTYRFENGSGGHPIRIQSTSGASGTAYNTGVTNNAGSGTVIVEVQHDAPDVLYYQCTSHSAMNGVLYITGALPDGGVTTAKIATGAVTTEKINDNAVTSAKIADQAVTTAKLANGAVDYGKLADGAVLTAKIADNAVTGAKIADTAVTLAKLPHGTSSNDGKFLRANNGADPSFETVTSTTINNNADNRVITGSGTANTLNGESGLVFDGTNLGLGAVASGAASIGQDKLDIRGGGIYLNSQSTALSGSINKISFLKLHPSAPSVSYEQGRLEAYTENGYGAGGLDFYFGKLVGSGNYAATHGIRLNHQGNVGIKTTSPIGTLDVHDGTFCLTKPSGNSSSRNWRFLADNAAAGNLGIQCSTAAGGSTFSNKIEIDSSGDVGLGTTSMLGILSMQAMTNARVHFRNIGDIQSAQAGAGVGIDVLNDGNSANMDCAIRAANIYLRTTEGESVRINRHGFVKMKGNCPNHMSADGDNYHEMQADQPNIQILNMKHLSSNGYGIMMQLNHNKATHWAHRVYNFANGQTRMYIRADGDLENTNNSYGSTSDVKLKENIVDAPSQWDDVKALRVRNFNYIADENKQKLLGLVAQEAETVCPSLVKEQPDTDEENEDLGTTTKFLKYSILYMKAFKALQEAQTRIETLETKVAALEAA